MNIKLYIGAHKTATTHIQGILESSRHRLANNEITVSLPRDIRSEWLKLFLRYCNDPDSKTKQKLLTASPKVGTWILSEENFSGTPIDFMLWSGIYPNILTRLKTFIKLYPDANTQVYFSIRSYETFYRSMYLEVVRNRGYIPFLDYYDNQRFKQNSWINVIDALAASIPENNINLWCYENFNQLIPEILQGMTDLSDTEKLISEYKTEITRPSLSNESIRILESLHPVLSQTESKQIIERLNNSYPVNKDNGYYQPFSTQQINQFQLKYRQDKTIIKNKYHDINFLGEM